MRYSKTASWCDYAAATTDRSSSRAQWKRHASRADRRVLNTIPMHDHSPAVEMLGYEPAEPDTVTVGTELAKHRLSTVNLDSDLDEVYFDSLSDDECDQANELAAACWGTSAGMRTHGTSRPHPYEDGFEGWDGWHIITL